jgi:hypothetical protein
VQTEIASLLEINGAQYQFQMPISTDASLCVFPLRESLELMGARVTWNRSANMVTASLGGKNVKFIIGSKICIANGKEVRMEVSPYIYEGKAYVLIRHAAEALGFAVGFRQTQSASILSVADPPGLPYTKFSSEIWTASSAESSLSAKSNLKHGQFALLLNLNVPSYNLDEGRNVCAIESGVISNLSAADGFVEIRHSLPSSTGVPGLVNHLYNSSGDVSWYSGYARMSLANGLKIGQLVEKGSVLGAISNVNSAGDSTLPKHLRFAVYDKDGYSFSPYFLSDDFKAIDYKAESAFTRKIAYR